MRRLLLLKREERREKGRWLGGCGGGSGADDAGERLD